MTPLRHEQPYILSDHLFLINNGADFDCSPRIVNLIMSCRPLHLRKNLYIHVSSRLTMSLHCKGIYSEDRKTTIVFDCNERPYTDVDGLQYDVILSREPTSNSVKRHFMRK